MQVHLRYLIYAFLCIGVALAITPAYCITNPIIFGGTVFEEAISKSELLVVIVACGIACSMPMCWDLFADFIFGTSDLTSLEKSIFVSTIVIPNTIFLVLHGNKRLPYLYIMLNLCQILCFTSAIYSAISKLCPNEIPAILFLGALFFQIVEMTMHVYGLAFPNNRVLSVLYSFAYACTVIFIFCIVVVWIMKLWGKRKRTLSQVTAEENVASMYIFTIVAFFVINPIINVSQNATTWATSGFVNLSTIELGKMMLPIVLIALPSRSQRLGSTESARRLLDLKRTFVRYVSHEIRSPLNVSHAGLEMAKRELETTNATPSLIELISDIYEANDTAITILNDLLQYEHIDAGSFKLDMTMRRVVGLLRGKLKFCSLLTKKKNIRFSIIDDALTTREVDFDQDFEEDILGVFKSTNQSQKPLSITTLSRLFMVKVDMPRIDQVIRNIITNAVKFTPPEGRLTIRTHIHCPTVAEGGESPSQRGMYSPSSVESTLLEPHFLRISVTDTGAGIAMEHQNRVFGEFSQFDRNELQSGGGSGLGLWLSRNIVSLHGGNMDYSSKGSGKGSTFYVDLPLIRRTRSVDTRSRKQLSTHRPSNAERDISVIRSVAKKDDNTFMNAFVTKPLGSAMKSVRMLSSRKHASVHAAAAYDDDDDDEVHSYHGVNDHIDDGDGDIENQKRNLGGNHYKAPRLVRILLVDDSAMNRKVMKRLIEAEVKLLPLVTVTEADDGTTAVEAIRNSQSNGEPIDCVFMDFIMTNMHGPEAANIMRNTLNFTGVIIAVTGNVLAEDYNVFLQKGANAVLTKPVYRVNLLCILSEYGLVAGTPSGGSAAV